MTFDEFKKSYAITRQEITREVFHENRKTIRVKKEKTATKNLELIFDAVFKVSQNKGFQAMTMRDLSTAANMSLGALYGYFASKEDLLSIIQRQGRTLICRVLDTCADREEGAMEKLELVIKTHLFLSEVARPWFFFSFMEARNLNAKEQQEVQEMEAFTEDILYDILVSGTEKGLFKAHDHRMTASIIKAMQQEWYLKRWKYKRRKVTVEQYAETVLAFVRSYLKEGKP